jgi:hypothetical protein
MDQSDKVVDLLLGISGEGDRSYEGIILRLFFFFLIFLIIKFGCNISFKPSPFEAGENFIVVFGKACKRNLGSRCYSKNCLVYLIDEILQLRLIT